jgi:hypothetical protein
MYWFPYTAAVLARRSALARTLAALIIAIALGGCAGSSPDAEEPPVEPTPLCAGARLATPHHADGRPAQIDQAPPSGCLYHPPGLPVEPTIGVHPSGAVFYYPVFADGCCSQPSIARSTDNGTTWELLKATLMGRDMHEITFDPYLYLDPATGRLFVDDLSPAINCSVISWSDDVGETWDHTPVGGCMEFDHQNLFAGPPTVSPTVGYPNVVYRCAANTVALNGFSTTSTCQRSLDGGRAWLPPGEPAFGPNPTGRGHMGVPGWCDGLVGHGATGPDGTVYLPKGWCAEPWLAISKDEGMTWSRTKVSELGFLQGNSGFNGHDAGVGIDSEGTVYYGWVAKDRMPYIAVSRDGGASFEAPMMVALPGINEASHPELIAGGPGKVAFLYLATTNSPGEFAEYNCLDNPTECLLTGREMPDYSNTTWNFYITVSTNADQPDPTFWTVALNDPADPILRGACGELRCGADHDFFDIRIGPDGSAWAALGDSCIDACVTDPDARGGSASLVGRVVGVDLRS